LESASALSNRLKELLSTTESEEDMMSSEIENLLENLEKDLKRINISPTQSKLSVQEINQIKSDLSQSVEEINNLCDDIVLVSKQDPKDLLKNVSKTAEVTKRMVDSCNKIIEVIPENKGKEKMFSSTKDLMNKVMAVVKNSITANNEPKTHYDMLVAYDSLESCSKKVIECLDGKPKNFFFFFTKNLILQKNIRTFTWNQ
jgi:histidinol dehydrogenase